MPGLAGHLKTRLSAALSAAFLAWASALTARAQTIVYQTGFAAPGFVVGNLAGQNGWSSGSTVSRNAAQVISVAGIQELQVSGPLIALNSPAFYYCSFTKSLTNYSPVAAGTPIVDISAGVWQEQGPTTSQATQFTFLILNDQKGNAFGTIGIDQNGVVFGQNWDATNQVIGDGSTATNGFHSVKMELNFTNQTITGFKDGFSIGTMSFYSGASNELGSVTLVVERYSSSPIDSTLLVDNLSVTAGSIASPRPCDLQITSAGPWSSTLANGAPGPPEVGNIYELYVTFNVRGQPTNAFRIEWLMANVKYYYDNINVGPGTGYTWYFTWWLALDDSIPWSVTLDPDGVSGNTNLANTVAGGRFTPIPPPAPVELYSPRMMHGFETYTLNFQLGSGNLNDLWVVFGVPTSHGAQTAISVTNPTNAQTIVTPPCGIPVSVIGRTNVPAAVFSDTNYFTVQLNDICVNPAILRTNTWAEMGSLSTNWTQWIAPDQMCQSTNPLIVSFVAQSLPANYQQVLTPYDTARALHCAVEKKITYQSPPFHVDAVGVLQDGVADCGGYAHLLTACLRCAGIPARMISGFWEGDTIWHCRTEFHLPGVEWLLADATEGSGADPTGTYAYYFGYVPDANSYLAVDTGDAHILPYNNFTFLQVPNWWWTGGGTYNSYTASTYLQPNGVLSVSNTANGSFQVYLNDPPTAGSVVLQTSTNLRTWTSIATNAGTGVALSYLFPNTNGPFRFYRANVTP